MKTIYVLLPSWLGLIILILAASACQPVTRTPPEPPATQEVIATLSNLLQPPTRLPTGTSPSGSTSPTPPSQVINPQNAAQLETRLRLTNGKIMASPFYSPDGSLFLVPTAAGIFLHDAQTMQLRQTIPSPVYHGLAAISQDNRLLAFEQLAEVGLYDLMDGTLVHEFAGPPGSLVSDLAFSPDGELLAAGFDDGKVRVWRLPDGKESVSLPGDQLEFAPETQQLAVVESESRRIHLFNTATWKQIGEWSGEKVTFSPDGTLGILDNGAFRLYDPETGQVLQAFNGYSPAFSPDGSLLALFNLSKVHLFDISTGSRIRSVEGNYAEIPQLVFSPDGQTLAGATIIEQCPGCLTTLGPLALWRVSDGSLIQSIEGYNFAPWLAFDPKRNRLAAVESDRLQLINPANGSPLAELPEYAGDMLTLAFSPDGQQLATAGYASDSARLWQVSDGKLVMQFDDPAHGTNWFVGNMAFSPDGKTLATGIDLWSLPGGKELRQLEQKLVDTYHLASSSVAFTPAEDTVLFGFLEGRLDLWDLTSQSIILSLEGYTGEVTSLSYSPNGTMLASVFGYPNYTIQIWGMPEAKPLRSFSGEQFFKALFSPDGKRLASLSAADQYRESGILAGIAKIWSADDGEQLVELPVKDAASLAFSPDGALLATGSYDGSLRLWQVSDGRLLQTVQAHFAPLLSLAFSSDGRNLASGSEDGSAFLWGLPGQE